MIKFVGIALSIFLATYFLPNQQPIDVAEAATTPTIPATSYGLTYYVRTDGGTPAQCDGKTNAALAGASGTNCAWSHPHYALGLNSSSEIPQRIAGGDRLIIANGSYAIGFKGPQGAYAPSCYNGYFGTECNMLAVPSGPSLGQPTRIVGIEYATGCKNKPQLWASQSSSPIINLTNTNNVEIQCLEITDRSSCNKVYTSQYAANLIATPGLSSVPNCVATTSPTPGYVDPPWTTDFGGTGIYAADSSNALLQNLNIHGLVTGVNAGRLTNWTVNSVRIAANSSAGWNGDIAGADTITGTLTMTNILVEFNGCSETYPAGKPWACVGQQGGGYGDGLGVGAGSGDWSITDSVFRYNVSDGIDLLYHDGSTGSITLNRIWAEGNAGNQIKVSGPSVITNSVAIGNCKYTVNFPDPYNYGVDDCRAAGDAVVTVVGTNIQAYIINNTIIGGGNCMIVGGLPSGVTTVGTATVNIRNNILIGDGINASNTYSGDTCSYFSNDTPSLVVPYSANTNLVNTTRNSAWGGSNITNSVSSASVINNINAKNLDPRLKTGSVAINAGTTGTNVPSTDYYRLSRPQGAAIDIGAVEKR
jgi:hypothetical protein